jgi:hypothetical protein
MTEQISGFFLSFSEEQKTEICNNLETNGYSRDIDGLKQFIIDELTGDVEETDPDPEPEPGPVPGEWLFRAVEYATDHPEVIDYYKNMFGSAFTRLFNKKARE